MYCACAPILIATIFFGCIGFGCNHGTFQVASSPERGLPVSHCTASLEIGRLGIYVKAPDHPVRPIKGVNTQGQQLTFWPYSLSLHTDEASVRVVNWRVERLENGTWSIVKDVDFSPQEFARLFDCDDALLIRGRMYTAEMTWTEFHIFEKDTVRWSFRGVNQKGEKVSGSCYVQAAQSE